MSTFTHPINVVVRTGYTDVLEFMQHFDLPIPDRAQLLDELLMRYRVNFLQEELDEFVESFDTGDLVKSVDALIDLVYVAYGTALFMGVTPEQWSACWYAVHDANLAKRRAVSANESKRSTTLDMIKPEGWQSPEPEIRRILEG